MGKISRNLLFVLLFCSVVGVPLADAEEGSVPEIKKRAIGKRSGFFSKLFRKVPAVEKEKEEVREKVPGKGPAADEKEVTTDVVELAEERARQFITVEGEVPFYKDGPLQRRAPDQRLGQGTLVTVVKARRGWTDVRLISGEVGTVPSEVLRKAVASDFLAAAPAGGGLGALGKVDGPLLPEIVPDIPAPPLPEMISDDKMADIPLLILPPLPQ